MKRIMTVFAAVILLAGCKKEKTPAPQAGGQRNLVKLTMPNSTWELNYSYDSKGRVTVSNESTEDTYTFTFNGNTFTLKGTRKYENNRQIANLSGTLDAEGRIDAVTGTEEYVQGNVNNVQYNYEYNADGYLAKLTRHVNANFTGVYNYLYSNGDLTELDFFQNGQLLFRNTYEYDLSRPEKRQFTPHYSLGPMVTIIEGKPNSHLAKGGKSFDANNVQTFSFTRDFETDSEGYPVKEVVSGPFGYTHIYHYDK